MFDSEMLSLPTKQDLRELPKRCWLCACLSVKLDDEGEMAPPGPAHLTLGPVDDRGIFRRVAVPGPLITR